jgi:DNA helicase TIP49 (TBP-interacting protein)
MARKVKSKQIATARNAKYGFSLGYTNTGRFETTCSTSNPKNPIRQISYTQRHNQLTTTKCGCKEWKQMPNRSSMEHLTIKAGDHIAVDASTNTITTTTNVNCTTSNSAANTRTVPIPQGRFCFTKPYRKSLNSNISRLKTCVVTKEVKGAQSANEKIQRIKANLLTCEKANPKPIVSSRCRASG